jgi:hypothetical protein
MNNYFPLNKYNQFPRKFRPLLQRQDYEQDICRGSVGQNGSREAFVMESCNRAQRALYLLERQGWCWGGGQEAASDHWLACAKMPGYSGRTGQYAGDTFSASEIRNERKMKSQSRH